MRELLEKLASMERRIGALERQERPAPVVAVYQTDAGQSIPNASNTVVNFEDQVIDTHSAVTIGASWQFVAPLAGCYLVVARITFAGSTNWTEVERVQMDAVVNGSGRAQLGWGIGLDGAPAAAQMGAGGAAVVVVAAGDAIAVRVNQNSGGSLALLNNALFNHVGIFRIH